MPNLDSAPSTGVQDNAAIVGLRVKQRPCRACGCISATIAKGEAIACDSCGRKRGRIDDETHRFLRNFIAIFGRPTSPIEIRSPSSSTAGGNND